ncbi:hypothetical protein B0J12DRAFT_245786 [Macrophomina phaseolina]|uniref:Tr-type G domain-containing protein n=1 Tax=Macrophomina phaseolina TaxID=35725 RepID=A0ABQ8G159_9PEZI|nr:hypothetical protein B0J12DRAFT_245786 [Macrophomina phaseolina]
MASIFTFDPDPPRVASPWSTPRSLTPREPSGLAVANHPPAASFAAGGGLEPRAVLETDSAVTRLDAEPQEGPTEYKLHLLLRPRRSFTTSSTAHHVAGSHRSSLGIPTPRSVSETAVSRTPASTPPKAASSQSRQHRLEQLTTQLLWRLQQSSPYHSTSANELVVPQLPEAAEQLRAPPSLARLLPGLEESKGALYEIGVADDGTFVGLADDEMEESLTNLRAMAASLGCTVKVLRMIPVGECAWTSEIDETLHAGKLWVAEAFVKPQANGPHAAYASAQLDHVAQPFSQIDLESPPASEQLRVSLTGATMSGKSSLLGSLSTATLDNGRGKSRLSLLKHRHEIASGMTSSVTQELIGYTDSSDGSGGVDVINYASGNVDSWNDIHAACHAGRLVFLSDSAGHPRYRRTTVRGLMGWAPHWTLLCVPADNDEDTSGRVGSTPSSEEVLGAAAADVDLSEAHLELCLKLELPLIVVVTKLDLASKSGIRRTLSKLLTSLKAAGKKPSILPSQPVTGALTEDEFASVPVSELEVVRKKATNELLHDPLGVVPVVLTSSLSGLGIRQLHAILHELQVPSPAAVPVGPEQPGSREEAKNDTSLAALYHVEDVWRLNSSGEATPETPEISIVSGHLRYGTLHLGDELLLGPYPVGNIAAAAAAAAAAAEDGSDSSGSPAIPTRPSSVLTSRSFPGALHKSLTLPHHPASRLSKQHEWRRVCITSIRNLRLPVRTLHAGQVGSLGIMPIDASASSKSSSAISTAATALSSSTSSKTAAAAAAALQGRIRKGMVLVRLPPTNTIAHPPPHSCRAFVARFAGEGVRNLIVGSLAVTYIASVRASAKVVAIAIDDGGAKQQQLTMGEGKKDDDDVRKEDDGFGFAFEDEDEDSGIGDADGQAERGKSREESTLVTFQFVATREFIEVGARVLVMEGGRRQREVADRSEKSVVGLEGFVGKVVEWFG